MNPFLREMKWQLNQTKTQGLYRKLSHPTGLDFSSNDYLGLSRDPAFCAGIVEKANQTAPDFPLACPASRLLRGNTDRHQDLEQRLAHFKGTEAALIFPTGYQANIGLLTTLLRPQDRILSDEQNHASIIDGLRLSQCQKIIFPHRDLQTIENQLSAPHPEGRSFLVTESLFSMDGDIAPLDAYAELTEKHKAYLIIDDAHATGVFGQVRGSGLTEYFGVEKRTLAIVSTFGKAFGLWGAFVAGPEMLIEYLINRCRPFIFTTAVPPLLLYGVEVALEILATQPHRRQRVCFLADYLRQKFKQLGLRTIGKAGPIVPVVLGANEPTLAVAERLQRSGLTYARFVPPRYHEEQPV